MDEKFVRGFSLGVATAVGAAFLSPSVRSAAAPALRKGAKWAIKAFANSREQLAELQELAEDAFAEALSELKAEADNPDAAASAKGRTAKETAVEPKKA